MPEEDKKRLLAGDGAVEGQTLPQDEARVKAAAIRPDNDRESVEKDAMKPEVVDTPKAKTSEELLAENPWLRDRAADIDVKQLAKDHPNLTGAEAYNIYHQYQQSMGKSANPKNDLLRFTRWGKYNPDKTYAENKQDVRRSRWAAAIDLLANTAYHALNMTVGGGNGDLNFDVSKDGVASRLKAKDDALKAQAFKYYDDRENERKAAQQKKEDAQLKYYYEMQKFEAEEKLKEAIRSGIPENIEKAKQAVLNTALLQNKYDYAKAHPEEVFGKASKKGGSESKDKAEKYEVNGVKYSDPEKAINARLAHAGVTKENKRKKFIDEHGSQIVKELLGMSDEQIKAKYPQLFK